MDPQLPHCSNALPLNAKPIASQLVPDTSLIYYILTDNTFCLVDISQNKIVYRSQQVHNRRIGCLRQKDNLLFTGGADNSLNIFDARTYQLVHRFQRIPAQFASIDKSQHILAASTTSNIIFWDLNKMKQRTDFKDSFNGDVTCIGFEEEVSTNLLGCSVDGMINMFDLTQNNQEQAFSWCYKIMSSPASFSTARAGRALVRTFDHNLYKVEDGDFYGKISPNNPDRPIHILHSQFIANTNYQKYQYFSWSPENYQVQLWKGDFLDKSNQQKCMAYLYDVKDVQVFNVVQSKQGRSVGVWADEKGNVFSCQFTKEKRGNLMQAESEQMKVSNQTQNNNKKIWNFEHKNSNKSKSQQKQTKNGYFLQKPASSFNNNKKFKPY